MNRQEEGNERINFFMEALEWKGKIKNKEPHKCDSILWFDIDNIPENTIEYVKIAIECIKNKILYTEFKV